MCDDRYAYISGKGYDFRQSPEQRVRGKLPAEPAITVQNGLSEQKKTGKSVILTLIFS
jgi:hypothetical protein